MYERNGEWDENDRRDKNVQNVSYKTPNIDGINKAQLWWTTLPKDRVNGGLF